MNILAIQVQAQKLDVMYTYRKYIKYLATNIKIRLEKSREDWSKWVFSWLPQNTYQWCTFTSHSTQFVYTHWLSTNWLTLYLTTYQLSWRCQDATKHRQNHQYAVQCHKLVPTACINLLYQTQCYGLNTRNCYWKIWYQ